MDWNNKIQVKAYNRAYYREHKERMSKQHAAYYAAHRQEIAHKKVRYNDAHREKRNSRDRQKRVTDPNYRLAWYLRARLRLAILNQQKVGSAVRDLGISIPEFRTYIETKFKPGMSWQNHGEWHLDHIRPLSSFDLTDREQFLQAAHYMNYQPLWGPENLAKGRKYFIDDVLRDVTPDRMLRR